MPIDQHKKGKRDQGQDTDVGSEADEKTQDDDIGDPVPLSMPHRVPDTAIRQLDTLSDEKKAGEIAKGQYTRKRVEDLADSNLKGVVHEGMTQRHLEDTRDGKVEAHPGGMTLPDGRTVKPDFVVRDDQGDIKEIVDAKGYFRKDTRNPQASASSLTHMQNIDEASKYTLVEGRSDVPVTFTAPAETAGMEAVQTAVSELGKPGHPTSIEAVGTEEEVKQRMADLRTDSRQRFTVSDQTRSEIKRIQSLPVEERRAAMGAFMQSLTDDKGDVTTEGRNLQQHMRVERDGNGITLIDDDGTEQTIWYKEAAATKGGDVPAPKSNGVGSAESDDGQKASPHPLPADPVELAAKVDSNTDADIDDNGE